MTREAIDQRAALPLYLAMLAGAEPAGGLLELRWRRPQGGMGQCFHACHHPNAILELIASRRQTDVYVGAAPRRRPKGTAAAVERVWCLWADIDGTAALEQLGGFRPWPSVVVRSGGDRCAHAYWQLREGVSPEWARRANRRLALALGADMAATDPARILRPPGTLSHKYDPPRPVVCTRLKLDAFALRDVVGGLPDDPRYVQAPRGTQCAVRDRGSEQHPTTIDGLVRAVREAQIGNRNNVLFWAACRVRDDGLGDAVREVLRVAALAAGLCEHEADRTLASALETRAA